MKKVVGLICLVPVFACAGDKGGVAESNFEADGSFTDSDSSQSLFASGSYHAGISEYFGYGLDASLRSSNGKSSYVDSNSAGAGIDLFARRFDLGKIGLSYNYSYTRFDGPYGDISLNGDVFQVFANYYLNDFTFSVSRLSAHLEDADTVNNWNAWASVYLWENAKLTAGAGGMDAKDSYELSAEYQPSLFDDAASVFLSYDRSPDDDSFRVGVSYFFGTRVSLQQRDRQYR